MSMKTEDKAAEVTLQQCKDQVARSYNKANKPFSDWDDMISKVRHAIGGFNVSLARLEEASELYASQVSASKDREYTEMYNQMEKALSEQSGVINQQAVTISNQSKTIEELSSMKKGAEQWRDTAKYYEETIEELKKNSQSVFSKVKDLLAWRQTKDGKVVIKTSVQTCDELIDCITNLDKALNS